MSKHYKLSLGLKSHICHFVKWQIWPFNPQCTDTVFYTHLDCISQLAFGWWMCWPRPVWSLPVVVTLLLLDLPVDSEWPPDDLRPDWPPCCWRFFCCCLNLDKLKNSPKIAFKFPSFISEKITQPRCEFTCTCPWRPCLLLTLWTSKHHITSLKKVLNFLCLNGFRTTIFMELFY